jgi:octaprenyl-diphosphate synthase
LLGALEAVDQQEQLRIRGLIRDIVGHPEYRDEVVSFVKQNGGVEFAERRLEEYVAKAVDALGVFQDCAEKELLVKLAHFTAKRDK